MVSRLLHCKYFVFFLSFIICGCTTSKVYPTKIGKIQKGKYCVDLPQPILAFNDVELIYLYNIVVQNNTIFIHYEDNNGNHGKTYYVDLDKKELIRDDSAIFYTDLKTQRTERTWVEKRVTADIFFYVDNVEHDKVNKISYTYEIHGRGEQINKAITFFDNYNRPIKKILMPYYDNYGSVTSINTLHDKFIIIVSDLYNHHNVIRKNNGSKYSLYIYNINDLLKPCMYSTNLSKYYSLTDSVPSFIPPLDKNVIGKVVEN